MPSRASWPQNSSLAPGLRPHVELTQFDNCRRSHTDHPHVKQKLETHCSRAQLLLPHQWGVHAEPQLPVTHNSQKHIGHFRLEGLSPYSGVERPAARSPLGPSGPSAANPSPAQSLYHKAGLEDSPGLFSTQRQRPPRSLRYAAWGTNRPVATAPGGFPISLGGPYSAVRLARTSTGCSSSSGSAQIVRKLASPLPACLRVFMLLSFLSPCANPGRACTGSLPCGGCVLIYQHPEGFPEKQPH